MRKLIKCLSIGLLGWLALGGLSSVVQARPIINDTDDSAYTKTGVGSLIIAGGEGTFPDGAPIVPAGEFTGVVSIEIEYAGSFFICSGSVIGQRHVITASHCVDETGTGQVIDISDPTRNVRVAFNDGGAITDIGAVSAVDMHPDYSGFGLCGPSEAPGFSRPQCLNDDIAILTLAEDIPAGVEIYGFAGPDAVDGGSLLAMVGHGVSGDGFSGEGIPPNYAVKRFGFNLAEFFDCDDESSFPDFSGGVTSTAFCGGDSGPAEVWYADFDGFDSDWESISGDGNLDTFCTFFGIDDPFLCDTGLGDDLQSGLFEAQIGGGDSGGPSFIYDSMTNEWLLAGNNTFGTCGISPFSPEFGCGYFGEIFGGNIYAPYVSWISQFLDDDMAVPEPATLGLLGMGLMLIGASRRRRKL